MLKKDKNIQDVNFILDNLRKEDLLEVQAIWGEDWKGNVIVNALKTDFMILMGKNNKGHSVPIAIGGFACLFEKDSKIACVWLLCSKYVYCNKQLLMKTLKEQIELASCRYDVLYNYIYKSNFEAKRWLKKLGFSFNNPHPDNMKKSKDFEFFYKINN